MIQNCKNKIYKKFSFYTEGAGEAPKHRSKPHAESVQDDEETEEGLELLNF